MKIVGFHGGHDSAYGILVKKEDQSNEDTRFGMQLDSKNE